MNKSRLILPGAILLLLVAFYLAMRGGAGGFVPIEPPEDRWFETAVSNQKVPVILDFSAEWCGPCKQMEPELEKLETRMNGRLKVVKIDVDMNNPLARHYRVTSIPCLLLMEQGKMIDRREGYQDAEELYLWAAKNFPSLKPMPQ